uniref:uncharacterized protein n=1 Tax=Myxine glutinosa TaxID=7769 RepID=UPI00358F18A8
MAAQGIIHGMGGVDLGLGDVTHESSWSNKGNGISTARSKWSSRQMIPWELPVDSISSKDKLSAASRQDQTETRLGDEKWWPFGSNYGRKWEREWEVSSTNLDKPWAARPGWATGEVPWQGIQEWGGGSRHVLSMDEGIMKEPVRVSCGPFSAALHLPEKPQERLRAALIQTEPSGLSAKRSRLYVVFLVWSGGWADKSEESTTSEYFGTTSRDDSRKADLVGTKNALWITTEARVSNGQRRINLKENNKDLHGESAEPRSQGKIIGETESGSKPHQQVADDLHKGSIKCAYLHAFSGKRELHATCSPQGPLRACLVHLDVPEDWFTSPSVPTRSPHWLGRPAVYPSKPTPPTVDIFYSSGKEKTCETNAGIKTDLRQEKSRAGLAWIARLTLHTTSSTDSPPQRENTTAKTPLWSTSPESQEQRSDPQNRTPNIWAIAAFTPTDEVLNTAVLTGRAVSLPLRVLGVSSDGHLFDVTPRASCRAPQPDILKVSANCQSVVLEGRERWGSTRASLLLSLENLSTTLTLHVWFPQLPLRLALSDGHLSPIKSWRAPRPGDSRGGCRLQSQRALLRVWTHLCANVNSHQLTCLPGPDWMADVTSLVRNHLTIEDKRVAVLIAGRVVVGRTPGTTAVQVLSPFSDAILGERVLTVGTDRTALRSLLPRPVASLQLHLSPEPTSEQDGKGGTQKANAGAASLVGGTWKIFNLSVQMNTSLSRPGQESVLALWVQFSDATTTPLELYPRESYHLEVDGPVLKNRGTDTAWPRIQPSVIVKPSPEARVRLFGACRKIWSQGPLASGTAKVVGQPQIGSRQASAVPDAPMPGGPGGLASIPPARAGGMRLEPTTQPITPTDNDHSDKEGQIMITRSSSDDLSTIRPSTGLPVAPSISDLQAGVLTFLAAFGLALALFAANCAIMVARRRRLKAAAPPAQPEEVAAREWHRNATSPCVELPRSVTHLGDKREPLLHEAVVTGSGHRKRVTFASVATVHSSAEVQRAIPQEWISMETVSDLA